MTETFSCKCKHFANEERDTELPYSIDWQNTRLSQVCNMVHIVECKPGTLLTPQQVNMTTSYNGPGL